VVVEDGGGNTVVYHPVAMEVVHVAHGVGRK
jgi:hypothetical protein